MSVGQNDANDSSIGIGHIDNWSSGAFDAAAWGHTQTDSTDFSWAALSLVLKPELNHDLTATRIATGAPVVGNPVKPVIGQKHALTTAGLTTTPTVGTPAIGQIHILLASLTPSYALVDLAKRGSRMVRLVDGVLSPVKR